jgi:hypothetical protein
MPVIPVFGRQRQEDWEFKASLHYMVRLDLKKKKLYPIICMIIMSIR